jgi:hypothetical protein
MVNATRPRDRSRTGRASGDGAMQVAADDGGCLAHGARGDGISTVWSTKPRSEIQDLPVLTSS